METIIPLAVFAFATSVTPGPNNLMLMASGVNFGFRRTLPHMLGVALGFVFLAILVGLGLAQIFERWPILHTVLSILSIAYLLWLAWRIANAAEPGEAREKSRPMTFLEAAAFQWVNPKVWAMALPAVTIYAPGTGTTAVLTAAAVFGAINLPTVSSWCLLGTQLRRFLTNPKRLRIFNWTMAFLLVATLVPFVI